MTPIPINALKITIYAIKHTKIQKYISIKQFVRIFLNLSKTLLLYIKNPQYNLYFWYSLYILYIYICSFFQFD